MKRTLGWLTAFIVASSAIAASVASGVIGFGGLGSFGGEEAARLAGCAATVAIGAAIGLVVRRRGARPAKPRAMR
ncbi:hypothetical protein [Trinickia acidisoli]|uniref:hypothetical protein n=1 Tax=Trinickia acidisoli TaxID=2767482 RepID=UPI001A90C2FE|nr:hypothetical protein [Trinickia acidisoli]